MAPFVFNNLFGIDFGLFDLFALFNHDVASILDGEVGAFLRRPCSRLKTDGTKMSVAIVAQKRPPMTARPSGAFCSPPSPEPRAMGIIPMIIASAVISTGR